MVNFLLFTGKDVALAELCNIIYIVNNSGVKYVHRTIHVQVCIKLNHYGMTERDKAKTTRSEWTKEQVYFLKNLSTF